MLAYILRRLAAALPVVLGITLIAFLLVHVVPGDPAKIILFGTDATPAQLANLRRQLGLEQPLWQQYVDFLKQLLHGNLGTSYLTQNSVAHEILSRTPSTLELAFAAIAVAIVVGFPLGMVGGAEVREGVPGEVEVEADLLVAAGGDLGELQAGGVAADVPVVEAVVDPQG